jgi:hypothetical protein
MGSMLGASAARRNCVSSRAMAKHKCHAHADVNHLAYDLVLLRSTLLPVLNVLLTLLTILQSLTIFKRLRYRKSLQICNVVNLYSERENI